MEGPKPGPSFPASRPGAGTPIETKSQPSTLPPLDPPSTFLGQRLQGWDTAAGAPRRLVVDPPDDGPDPRIVARSPQARAQDAASSPGLPGALSLGSASPHPSLEDLDARINHAVLLASEFGARREDLPPHVQMALQHPSTLYALMEGIQEGLALPAADSQASIGQRIADLAEGTMNRIIEEFLAEPPTVPAGLPMEAIPAGPATAAEIEAVLHTAVDEALEHAIGHGEFDDAVIARLGDASTSALVFAEAFQDFAPPADSTVEEAEVLAFLAARHAVTHVAATFTATGSHRLHVEGPADVRQPFITHLADDAALSDDEDAAHDMPPSPVNGVSPDTGFAAADPAWEALVQAMKFGCATAGIDYEASLRMLGQPAVAGQLLAALRGRLADRGFADARQAPEAVLRESAKDATTALLRSRGYVVDVVAQPAAEAEPPTLDELEQRFAALLKADRKG